jgi:chemotaxis protein MotA
MDILTFIGAAFAFIAIFGGFTAEGGSAASLVNTPAVAIVVVGTFAAVMVHTPLRTFRHALNIMPWVFRPPRLAPEEAIRKIVNWSHVARSEGLLGLEVMAEKEPDLFARKGLLLLVDGTEPDTLRGILKVDLTATQRFDTAGARVFESAGVYAPRLGIIGALLGLMVVMQNLGDPSKLGPGIAAALVATIYGMAAANLLLLPMSNKLKSTIHDQTQFREMIIEGLIAIAEGENPRNIETKLQGYLP